MLILGLARLVDLLVGLGVGEFGEFAGAVGECFGFFAKAVEHGDE